MKSSKKSRRESLATTVDFLRRFLGPREQSDRGLTNSKEVGMAVLKGVACDDRRPAFPDDCRVCMLRTWPREQSDRGLTNSSERPPLKRGGSSAEFALAEALLRAEALQHKKKNQALISLDSHIVHWSFTHVQLWLQLHLNFVQVRHTYLLGYGMPLRLPREVNCQMLLMHLRWYHVIHIVS